MRGIKGPDILHERLGDVYTGEVREKEESTMRREDRTDLNRFRTGPPPEAQEVAGDGWEGGEHRVQALWSRGGELRPPGDGV